MPRFCANLTLLYNEAPFQERFQKAASAGFKGVEYLFPYDYPAEVLREKLEKNKLQQVLHNMPAGDWGKGDRGIACDPKRVGEFQDSVEKAITYAKALDCQQINCLAGLTPANVPAQTVRETFIRNLQFTAPLFKAAGIRLLIEPINDRIDMPGFYLNHTQQALDIIAATGSDNLFLQYDIYHMQIMEGNLALTIEKNLSHIAHLQLADHPGRHEPGTGEIHYPFLFDFIDKIGYPGWIGCEYKPSTDTDAGLGWLKPYIDHRAP